jgi:hypothetical protein
VTKDETVSTDAAFKALTFNKLYELAQSGFFFAIMDQFQLPSKTQAAHSWAEFSSSISSNLVSGRPIRGKVRTFSLLNRDESFIKNSLIANCSRS